MPGSVANSSATVVFPWALARSFRRTREFPVREARYLDGHREVGLLAAESRKSWALEQELSPTEMGALRTFWTTNRHKAMVFYDTEERAEEGLGWSYDDTGVAAGPGKYEVRLDGDELLNETSLARVTCGVRLVEIV